ncbi:uncharacterized protein Z518_10176 [Rhinocladiella mackenziei CBS 650.93]|uniref:Rhinocladiella mackenziei CBS 650.93 unplaced genomic scaffold supercont1.8, whole genome shotgun sequence n=1 Tax=Rhinocladiella mackenziei CBS 650.93 TaxID=1442369 RepID=A0A0D2IWW2_9EURO|nr:uncharacterized protein Z518_10176 [Rhinocladiella mackenziei CBS 650.93]KIX01110.1 hypothetical protein Z518_10176 [Rhinocladiella mackenziei CBS 650.93]
MADAKDPQHHSPLEPRRACQECNRKKTKCDMRRPICGLCSRTGNTCHFPSKRKKPTARKPQPKVQSRRLSDSISKLVQVLEAASRGTGVPDGRREISQSFLQDSLKGLLAEINTSQDHGAASHDSSLEIIHGAGSPPDGEDVDDEGADVDGHSSVPSPLRESMDFNAKPTSPPTVSGSDGEISCSMAVDLVNLFFDKVQPWLPILHRPRFQARYEHKLRVGGHVIQYLSVDESLLFYSMFAMSARFSNHPKFATVPAEKRGHEFAERARAVYSQARSLRAPTLMYLQGCILLAFYFYTSGPTHQGWILIGVCVRLAYDLGLSEIDDDDWTPISSVDSVEKEEMRRAWWLVWELDTFASTVSRKPFSIDRKRMCVALPISDEAWFSETDVPSSELVLIPGQSWRSLQGSRNQDERAWFLVANNFMATVHDRLQQRQDVSAEEKLTLENEICCFKLALPPPLRLDAETLTYTPSTFARCNWVIGTHLMLKATSFMVSGIATTENDDRSVSSMSGSGTSPIRLRAIELSRIISLWDSRYIAVAHPFFTCMMLPPYAVDGDVLRTQPLLSSSHEMAKLVLSHFAEKWKLGSVVLELAKILERGGTVNAEEKQLARRYALFFRMPRLSTSSPNVLPPELNRRDRNSPMTTENTSRPSRLDMQQQQAPPPQIQNQTRQQEEYAASLSMPDPANVTSYQAPMFDPQNLPPLQQTIYDGSNEIEFGFSDFFGGSYRDTDFMLT